MLVSYGILYLVVSVILPHNVYSGKCFKNKKGWLDRPIWTWPPSVDDVFRNLGDGAYDVRISPLLTEKCIKHNTLEDMLAKLKKRYKGKIARGTCLYKAVWLHHRVKGRKLVGQYDYYPQPVSYVSILTTVRKGRPVYEMPRNDKRLTILTLPKTCSHKQQKYDLVFLINSCVSCAPDRAISRKTYLNPRLWSKFRIGYAFVLGKPARQCMKTFTFYGAKVRQPRTYSSKITANSLFAQLLTEANIHKDMLIGDFEDGLFSYTWSYILAIRWASIFCNRKSPAFAYIDGRYTVFPQKLANYLKKVPIKKKERMYQGQSVLWRVNRKRRSVGFIDWQEIPWTYYPRAIHGSFVLLGHKTVQDAAILSAWTRYFRGVGVYIAIVNRKLHYKPVGIRGVYHRLKGQRAARGALVAIAKYGNRYIDWKTGKAK